MPSLSDKYRPGTFADVVGQDDAIRILSKVDLSGRGIYLTGKSGTGKTTLARIVARSMADECCINETVARQLTPSGLKDWHDMVLRGRPLFGGGYVLIVNESHGMNKPLVELFLNILEKLPAWSCVIFTTTAEGNELFEDGTFDAGPFRSRCLCIGLAQRDIKPAMAARCKAIAESEGLDGKPIEEYVKLLTRHNCNMRAALTDIEAGKMLA